MPSGGMKSCLSAGAYSERNKSLNPYSWVRYHLGLFATCLPHCIYMSAWRCVSVSITVSELSQSNLFSDLADTQQSHPLLRSPCITATTNTSSPAGPSSCLPILPCLRLRLQRQYLLWKHNRIYRSCTFLTHLLFGRNPYSTDCTSFRPCQG